MYITLAPAPLRPTMTALDGYIIVLCDLFDSIDTCRHDTLVSTSPRSLHDLRIAIRRARSVVREAKRVLPSGIFDAMSQDLSWLSSITSEARDLDTLIDHWPRYERMMEARDVNHLQAVIREIYHRRNSAYQDMQAKLNGQRVVTLINEWQIFMLDGTDIGKGGTDAQNTLKDVVKERIETAHRKLVTDCGRISTKSSDDQIHALRKDAKRIRYLSEGFSEILSSTKSESTLSHLVALQDNLGEFQDLRIHESVIRDAISYIRPIHAPSTIEAAEELLLHMAKRRQKVRKKLIAEVLRA